MRECKGSRNRSGVEDADIENQADLRQSRLEEPKAKLQNHQWEISSERKGNSIMNWDQVEGNWKQMKGAVKEKWGKLTDDDLDRIAGKRDKLAGRVQECYGLHKELAENERDEWCNTAEDIMNKESAA
jgi:uncharacterized protein YjbJ (UPF0337 family)